jgi:hypothetical protein
VPHNEPLRLSLFVEARRAQGGDTIHVGEGARERA